MTDSATNPTTPDSSVRREALDEGVFLLDEHGHVCAATSAALAMTGCADVATLASRWRDALEKSGVSPQGLGEQLQAVVSRLGLHAHGAAAPAMSVQPAQASAHGDERYVVFVRRGGAAPDPMTDYLAVRMSNLTYLARSWGHEVRTPLCGTLLQFARLRELLEQKRTTTQTDRLATIARTVHEGLQGTRTDIAALIDRLRGDGDGDDDGDGDGGGDPALDLTALVRDAAHWTRIAAVERGAAVEARLGDAPLMCRGPRDRLEHAVLGVMIGVLQTLGPKQKLTVELTASDGHAEVSLRGAAPAKGDAVAAPAVQSPINDVRARHAGHTAEAMGGAFTLQTGADGAPAARFVLPVTGG